MAMRWSVPSTVLSLAALSASTLVVGCRGDGGTAPPAVASVSVTSPIGTRLAVGRTVQLAAEARDAKGGVVSGVSFTWSSLPTGFAQVTGSGLVSGNSPGNVTITARTAGVDGTIGLQVQAADLAGIETALDDPYRIALVAALTTDVRGRTQAAISDCTDGEIAGDFGLIESCLAEARAEVDAATDADDRAGLATLALFLDHIERLLDP